MSYALASDFAGNDDDAGWRRHRQRAALLLPLCAASSLPVSPTIAGVSSLAEPPRSRRTLGLLAVVAIAAHVALAAYLAQQHIAAPPLPQPPKTVLELTRPKPPEPKPIVEPPKPLPQVAKKAVAHPQPAPAPAPAPTPVESLAADTPVVYAEPTPPAPPAPAEPVKETQAQGYAGYLNNPAPTYPATAQRMGWQGTVLLKVRVLADGRPAAIEIQQSSGRKMLDEAALSTVRQWLFTPAKRGDVAIEGWATVPIDFKLG